MHHSTPSVAPRQPLLRTRGRYWPFSSVSAAHRFGSDWSTADMAEPAAGSARFAVGTVVTDRPPHRTARAEFPHAAPTLGV